MFGHWPVTQKPTAAPVVVVVVVVELNL